MVGAILAIGLLGLPFFTVFGLPTLVFPKPDVQVANLHYSSGLAFDLINSGGKGTVLLHFAVGGTSRARIPEPVEARSTVLTRVPLRLLGMDSYTPNVRVTVTVVDQWATW